ncbi:MAG: glycoside hydrolase family 65 protein [Spirochaetes bacterium]|nr:glycoside hydrolase family 65 protein [Spirochaetota bacterium]
MEYIVSDISLKQETLLKNESIFSIANGYIGVRGNFEEGYLPGLNTIRGTYLNAFYDTIPIHYPETAYGYPHTIQRALNLMDSQGINIILDHSNVIPEVHRISEYSRTLDMKKGIVTRSYIYTTKKNETLRITFKRMTSFLQKELFIINLKVEPITYHGPITIESTLNGNIENYVNDSDPRVANGSSRLLTIDKIDATGCLSLQMQTANSDLSCACASDVVLSPETMEFSVDESAGHDTDKAFQSFSFEPGKTVELTKYNIYTDSLRHNDCLQDALKILSNCTERDFQYWEDEQKEYLTRFWENINISILGDLKIQNSLRFNMYQLLQSVGRDRFSNVSAKGLTGEGYEGHFFWDTEIFILPMFLLTMPEIAKNLLMYRYNILDFAKEKAKLLGHQKGALFPWRTISGPECSAFFPAGTAQYHISGDIAYAFISYFLVTEDVEFMYAYGAEIIIETARLWVQTGHEKDGVFRIDCVTGPDEYTAMVNNNYYTNAIAKFNLFWAWQIVDYFKRNLSVKKASSLLDRLDSSEEEINEFLEISEKMFLPYDESLDINPQDDSFLNKKPWDFENTPEDKYPLLLNFHPLTIYRHQVLKQADTVLSHFLLEDYAGNSTIKNSFNYYEKISSHDSSLSACIYSMMACKIGDFEKAYSYFLETARLDLDDTHGNTMHGLHMANLGGTYMTLAYGFAGLRIKQSGLFLSPVCPADWDGYNFTISYRQRKISITVSKHTAKITVDGEPLIINVFGTEHFINDFIDLPIPE